MNVVMMGATRGMGLALARRFAARGDNLALLARNEISAEATAADLRVRGAASVTVHKADLSDEASLAPALAEAFAALATVDTVVLSAGLFATQDELEADSALASQITRVNFTSSVTFCEEARKRLLAQGGGSLVVFSSVAGDRGRKPVVIYGASKAGLSAYLEGLDHKYRSAGLKVITVKPGFVRTGMTAGLKAPPFAGEPEAVAQQVEEAITNGSPVVYAPTPWRFVMGVIRHLPRAVMRRVNF